MRNLTYAVIRLLAAHRPMAAFNHAHLDWGRVESGHVQLILSELPASDEWSQGKGRVNAHNIREALSVLNERNALSQFERAKLEFLYIDLFWLDEDGMPNLEKEIEANPELFCEAVMLAYPRKNSEAERKISAGERKRGPESPQVAAQSLTDSRSRQQWRTER